MMLLEQELSEIKEAQATILKLLSQKTVEVKERIYDQSEMMQLLHVSRRTLSTWREAGLITFTQVAGKIYYTQLDLDTFLEKHKVRGFKN